MPEELWMKVHDIVQEAGIKTIPKKNNATRQHGGPRRPYKPEKRKDVKGKVEYSLNAEFQRIARRDKKAFLSAKK